MGESHYLIRGGLEGRERLRVLGRVMRPTTLPLLERAGISAGMRVLDVGCGGGDVTFDLASLVGLTGAAVGVDVDATKIALAREDADQVGVTNVEFRIADLNKGLGEEEYDAIYVRFVLTHLREPEGAVETMRRALRRGGTLIVEDIDFRGCFCDPPSAAFDRYVEIYQESARATGGDSWIGTRVPRMRLDAGFERVRPNVVQPADLEGESTLMPALTMESIKAVATGRGISTEAEIDRLTDELYALARDPRIYLSNPRMVQVTGQRPQRP
jgi:SAM-dependent methyltransferase